MANQAVSAWLNRKYKEISHEEYTRIHKILKFNLFNRTPENLQPYQPLEVANASIDLLGLFFSLVTKKY